MSARHAVVRELLDHALVLLAEPQDKTPWDELANTVRVIRYLLSPKEIQKLLAQIVKEQEVPLLSLRHLRAYLPLE
jgi:hypothetical protein